MRVTYWKKFYLTSSRRVNVKVDGKKPPRVADREL